MGHVDNKKLLNRVILEFTYRWLDAYLVNVPLVNLEFNYLIDLLPNRVYPKNIEMARWQYTYTCNLASFLTISKSMTDENRE